MVGRTDRYKTGLINVGYSGGCGGSGGCGDRGHDSVGIGDDK